MREVDCEDLIEALTDLLEVAPDAKTLESIVGPEELRDTPMTAERFIACCHSLLEALRDQRSR